MIKKYFAVILTAVILSTSNTFICFAEPINGGYEELDDLDYAGFYLGDIMRLISEEYAGSDITIDELVQGAIFGMTTRLDEYSEFFTSEEFEVFEDYLNGAVYLPGIFYEYNGDGYPVVSELMQTDKEPKFAIGDIILGVESVSTKEADLQDIFFELSQKRTEDIAVEIIRNERKMTIYVDVESYRMSTAYSLDLKEILDSKDLTSGEADNVAYICVTMINEYTPLEFDKELNAALSQGKKRLILDLRDNPGGTVEDAISLCNKIVPAGPLFYTRNSRGEYEEVKTTLKVSPFEKIVVLTNPYTASCAEIIAAAIQDSKAGVVIGTKTYGKGIIQDGFLLPTDDVLKITTREVYTRNNRKLNNVGVIPDIKVDLPELITEDSNDESIMKSLRFMKKYSSSNMSVEEIVKDFQSGYNLEENGVIDAITANLINLAIYEELYNEDKILIEGYKEVVK